MTWLAVCAACAGQDQREDGVRREAMLLRARGQDRAFEYRLESEHAIPSDIETDFERFKERLNEFFASAGDDNRSGIEVSPDGRGVWANSRGRGVRSIVWADWREEPVLSIRGRAELASRSLIRFEQQRTPGRQEETHGYCLVEDPQREWSWAERAGRVAPHPGPLHSVYAADNGRLAVLLGGRNAPKTILIGEIGEEGGFREIESISGDEFRAGEIRQMRWVDEGRTLAVWVRGDGDATRTRFVSELEGEHGPEWVVHRVAIPGAGGRLRIGSAFSVETQRGVEFKTLNEAGRLIPGLVWRKRGSRDRLERLSPSGGYGLCYLGASGRGRGGDHVVVSMPGVPGNYEKRIGYSGFFAGWLSWDEPGEAGSGTR